MLTPTAMTGRPPADIAIDEALVRQLLREQHADLAELPLRHVDSGWDNELFQLGDSLAVRMPRGAAAARLIEREQQWLRVLAPTLPLPVPAPLRIGTPAADFPWRWSITPWLSGDTADVMPPDANQADALATFLRALHQPAPDDAPRNPFRGVQLRERARPVEERMARLATMTDVMTSHIRHLWTMALDAAPGTERRWNHGDLHPLNVLVTEGRLSGVLDWGDLNGGDVATDLASLWMLLPTEEARARAKAVYEDADESTWVRARGWAIAFGVLLFDAGLTNSPRHAALGARILHRVAERTGEM